MRVTKPRTLGRTGHVARTWERGAYRALVGKQKGKRPRRRPRLRWQEIKQVIRWEGVKLINLAQDYWQVAGS